MVKNIIITESQYKALISEITNKEITDKANEADRNPSEAQKEKGNYKMGHININGFAITIENPKGSYRKGVDKNGKEWKTKMNHHYGYFTKTLGYDGDHIDVFVGTYLKFDKIYVVDQVDSKGDFDESKVMLGFKDIKSAKEAYLSNFSSDWKGFKKITGVSIPFFKKWLYDKKKQRKPFYEYVDVKKEMLKESDGMFSKMASSLKQMRMKNTPLNPTPLTNKGKLTTNTIFISCELHPHK